MAETKKKKDMYYVHVAIGFGLMALMWVLPNPEPITPGASAPQAPAGSTSEEEL